MLTYNCEIGRQIKENSNIRYNGMETKGESGGNLGGEGD